MKDSAKKAREGYRKGFHLCQFASKAYLRFVATIYLNSILGAGVTQLMQALHSIFLNISAWLLRADSWLFFWLLDGRLAFSNPRHQQLVRPFVSGPLFVF